MEETEASDIENNFENDDDDEDDDDVIFIESLDHERKQEKAKCSLEVIDLTDGPDEEVPAAAVAPVAPEPTPIPDSNPIFSFIKDTLPDADPAFLLRKMNELTTDAQLHDFILSAMAEQNYPKINSQGTPVRAVPELPDIVNGGPTIAEEVVKIPCVWSKQLEFLLNGYQPPAHDTYVPPLCQSRHNIHEQQHHLPVQQNGRIDDIFRSSPLNLDQLLQDVAEVTQNYIPPFAHSQQFHIYRDGGQNVLAPIPNTNLNSDGGRGKHVPISSITPTFDVHIEDQRLLRNPPLPEPQKSNHVAKPTASSAIDLSVKLAQPSTSKVSQPMCGTSYQVGGEDNGVQNSTSQSETSVGSNVPTAFSAFVSSANSTITSSDVPQIDRFSSKSTGPIEFSAPVEFPHDSFVSNTLVATDHSYASRPDTFASVGANDPSVAGSSSKFPTQDGTSHVPTEAASLNCKLLPRPTVIHTTPYTRLGHSRPHEMRELEMTYRHLMPKPGVKTISRIFPNKLDQMGNVPVSLNTEPLANPVDTASLSRPLSVAKEPIPRPVTFANALPFIQPPSVIKKEPLLMPNLISDTPTSNFSVQNHPQFPSPSVVTYAVPAARPPQRPAPPLSPVATVPAGVPNPNTDPVAYFTNREIFGVNRPLPIPTPTCLADLRHLYEPMNLTTRDVPQRPLTEPRRVVFPMTPVEPRPPVQPPIPRPPVQPPIPRPPVQPPIPRPPVQPPIPRPPVQPLMPLDQLMDLGEERPPIEPRANADNAHNPERDLFELRELFNIRERRRMRYFQRRLYLRHAHPYIFGGLQGQVNVNGAPRAASTSRQKTEAEERFFLVTDVLYGADPVYLRKELMKLQNKEDVDKFLIRAFAEEDLWNKCAHAEGCIHKQSAKKTMECKLKILMNLLPKASPTFLKRECVKLNSDEELQEFASKVLHDQNYPKRKSSNGKKDGVEVLSVETAPSSSLNTMYVTLVDMLPDGDPVYLYEQSKKFTNSTDLESFVLKAVEEKSYPKRDQLFKRQEYQKLWKKYIEDFDIKGFLLLYPNPIKYFYMEKKNSTNPLDIPLKFLQHRYRRKNANIFGVIYSQTGHSLAKTCDRLDFNFPYKPKMLQVWDGDMVFSTAVLQEIAFIQNRREIAHYLLFQENFKAEALAKAKEEGTLQECVVCCNEKLPEDMMKCNGDHAYCTACVKRGSDVVIGEGGTSFPCFSPGCKEEFPLSAVQNLLTPEAFSRLQVRKQYAEVSAAGIPGLETCPFCEFCSVPPPEDKLFHCLNPSCVKITCRKCKKVDHLPLSCEEFARKVTQHKMQNYVEEQMTEALVRTCWQCGAKFVKESGCNMMSCKCGAKMCYVCRKPVEDYTHFSESGCLQNVDTTPRDERNVIDVGKRAKEEMEAANPGVELINDPTKPNISIHENI